MIIVTDFAMVTPAVVGAIVALGLVALLHRVRERKRLRDAHLYEIPPFLRGTNDPRDGADSRFKGNWTEIHPLPKHISKGEE